MIISESAEEKKKKKTCARGTKIKTVFGGTIGGGLSVRQLKEKEFGCTGLNESDHYFE